MMMMKIMIKVGSLGAENALCEDAVATGNKQEQNFLARRLLTKCNTYDYYETSAEQNKCMMMIVTDSQHENTE